jgi:hypothetical protein
MPFGHSKQVSWNDVDDISIGVVEDGVAMRFHP